MKNHIKSKGKTEEKQTSGRKRQCGCGKHNNVFEHKEEISNMKKNETKQNPKQFDLIPAKFDLCEYCANYFEEIEMHLSQCEVKKFIEEEDKKYYNSLRERLKHDETIASQINKEEQKKTIDDEKVSIALQLEYEKQNAKQTMNDIDIAKKLQEEFDKQNPLLLNDAELAKKLQLEFEMQEPKKSTDAELAQKLQLEFQNQNQNNYHPDLNDEELAKKYEKEEFNQDN